MQSSDGGIYFGSGIDTREFSKDIEKMRKDILSLTKEGEQVDLGGLTEQINIQKQAVKELEAQYKEVGKIIENMAPGLGQAKLISEHKKVGVAIEGEKKSLKDLQSVYKSFALDQTSIMSKQRALRNELELLATQGKQNTAEFHALLQELEGFDKARNTVAAFQQTMKRGNAGIQAFTGVLRAGTGAFTAFTGVTALFSDQNERLVELQTRLQSVMAISIGVEQTFNALRKEGRLIQAVKLIQMKASARAQALQTSSTIGATIAQRAFNLVAKANPYVLLAAAILSVVGALALMTKGQKKAVEEQRKINKDIAESTADVVVQFSLLREEWKRLGDDVGKQNKFIKERKGAFDELGISINDITDAESAFVKNSSKVVDAMVARAKGAAFADAAKDAYKEYLRLADEIVTDFNTRTQEGFSIKKSLANLVYSGRDFLGLESTSDKAKKELQKNLDFIAKSVDFKFDAENILAGLGLDKPLKEADKKLKKEQTKAQKTYKQMLDGRKALWEDYYKAIDLLGKDSADKVYGGSLDVNSNYIDELKTIAGLLRTNSNLTEEQAGKLILVNDAIADLTGAETFFEKQKKTIQDNLEGYDTYTEKLESLKKALSTLGDSNQDIKLGTFIKDEIKQIEGERQQMYDKLIAAHKSYSDKIADIDKKRIDLLAADKKSGGGKSGLIEEQIAIEKYDAYIEMVKKKYTDLDKVFSDIEALTRDKLIKFREVFENELAKTDDVAKKVELGKIIKNINEQLDKLDSNPLKKLAEDFQNVFASADKAGKVKALGGLGKGIKYISGQFKESFDDIGRAAESLGVDMDSVFGNVIKSVSQTMEGIKQMGEGIEAVSAGILSSNPVQTIAGIIKATTGAAQALGAWIDMGSRAGREGARLTKELKKIEEAYASLQDRIAKASVGNLYNSQVSLIQNLMQQQKVLAAKMRAESKKWFPNIDDIVEWDKQIKEADKEISRVIDEISKGVLATDARTLSQQLGDALVDAFERGEDAAESLNKTVDDVFKQMVRNMIAASIDGRVQNIFNDIMKSMGINPKTGLPTGSPRDTPKLSPEDQKKYRQQLREAAESQQVFLDTYRELFQGIVDLDDEQRPDGLRGAIKGMTQETADILAGQFNAIRMDASGILTILRANESKVDMKLVYLGEIGENTSGIYKEIKDMNSKIKVGDIRSGGL